jgi:hypothetical protein
VVLVESSIPDDVPGVLLTIFGGTTAFVIALMLVSSLYAMYMLVAILGYDCVGRDVPFDEFWRKRCDPDFKFALRCFSYGIPLFMILVALVSWMQFWSSPYRFVASSVVTVIVFGGSVFWFTSISRKWTSFLLTSDSRILARQKSMRFARNDVEISMRHKNLNGASNEGGNDRGGALDPAAR